MQQPLAPEQIYVFLGFLREMAPLMTKEDLARFTNLSARLVLGPPSEEDERLLLELVQKFDPEEETGGADTPIS